MRTIRNMLHTPAIGLVVFLGILALAQNLAA